MWQGTQALLVASGSYFLWAQKATPRTEALVEPLANWLSHQQLLPTDPLSIQNGILVTRSSRYPMLIDPQGQALGWIRKREAERMPQWGTVLINDPKLKDKLEFAMGNDAAFVVVGVENTVDPMLDPLLEKEIIVKGRRKLITISDKQMDFTDGFMLYFITRLPNPSFSPELQAKAQQALESRRSARVPKSKNSTHQPQPEP